MDMEWESKEINRMCTQILAHIVDDQKEDNNILFDMEILQAYGKGAVSGLFDPVV